MLGGWWVAWQMSLVVEDFLRVVAWFCYSWFVCWVLMLCVLLRLFSGYCLVVVVVPMVTV